MAKRKSSPEQKFKTMMWLGTEALHRGRIDEAITHFEQARLINGEDIDAALNLGGAYILDKQYEKAVTVLENLTHWAPDSAQVWTNLGAAYLGEREQASDENQRKAIEAFKTALKLNPIATSVSYNIGLIHLDRGEKKEARDWFYKAIQNNPRDGDARAQYEKLNEELDDTHENSG